MIVKVAVVEPPATETLAGTCAAGTLLLCSVTVAPPVGAAPFNVTVPVELAPPTTELGLLLIDDRAGGLTVRDTTRLATRVAVMVVEVLVVTT